jgi:type I restriction enzyme R subunit
MQRIIEAENARLSIHSKFTSKQEVFFNFVLQHYVSTGVQELATEKLNPLLQLRYQNSIVDALADLGPAAGVTVNPVNRF